MARESIDARTAAVKAFWAAKTPEELEAHAAKISATKRARGSVGNVGNLAKGWDPETRARAIEASAEARRGKPLSEEQRKAIGESNRRAYAEGRRKPRQPSGKWATLYDVCQTCSTSEKPHKGHGLCERCWESTRTARKATRRKL